MEYDDSEDGNEEGSEVLVFPNYAWLKFFPIGWRRWWRGGWIWWGWGWWRRGGRGRRGWGWWWGREEASSESEESEEVKGKSAYLSIFET